MRRWLGACRTIDCKLWEQNAVWIACRIHPGTVCRFAIVVDIAKQQLTGFDYISRRGFLRRGRAFNRWLTHAVGETKVLVAVVLSPGCQRMQLGDTALREFK